MLSCTDIKQVSAPSAAESTAHTRELLLQTLSPKGANSSSKCQKKTRSLWEGIELSFRMLDTPLAQHDSDFSLLVRGITQ